MEIKTTKKVCDICGKDVDEQAWFVARDSSGEIIWESKLIGDYCPEHSDELICGGLQRSGIADRYDTFETDEERERQKAIEREIIGMEMVGGLDD